ncbi:ATP-dependent RNA helicase [Persicimonas caeni]|uniref:ATP-dependent RNA helicase n=1 Tax=Persicimonas caeni TaxID=2292766 RepID=A0A4Y6PWS6_PERCE|nr:helicase-related protein [Persicimonas caeni]QDG52680.1 ATP-dependent RNA helicase [Persicimonas caeni]QED33902.1 ATP-dependent RNA helicase [Persicimonas caeni]
MQLPVDAVREEFESALGAGAPLIVTAPTGSGKSTRLPLWMAERLDGPILVVEPRRVACRSLAGWLSEGRGEPVGKTIGYTVRFDDRTSDATEVVFATTGVALRMLGQNPTEQDGFRFAGVLIDEFHERSWQVDLILAVLRSRRQAGDDLPLVITSATLDVDALVGDLGANLIEASGRTYPVDVEYIDEPKAPSRHNLDSRVADAVKRALDGDDGDVLVFLPGKGEIADCEQALSKICQKRGAEAVAVHGGLPPDRMKQALAQSADKRRVYLSTNVAETSVTLPGVTTVIDSGLARMRIHRGGRSALALVPIAQDSMDQRAGRAGRVRPGRCIRLWSRRFRPQRVTAPEVERIELDDVLLHAGVCGLEGPKLDRAPWVTEPPEFAVAGAKERLVAVGAFDRRFHITPKGETLAELPVDGHDARMLIGVTDEMAGITCDLVALLQLNRPLMLSTGDRDVHRARAELCRGLTNEVFVEVQMIRRGSVRKHRLHGSALDEARKVSASLRELVDAPVKDPTRDDAELPDPHAFAEYLLERIPETAFVLRERAKRRRDGNKPRPGRSEPWANGEVELSVWPYSPPRLEHEDEPPAPIAGLVLDHFWLGDGGTGVRGTGRMVLPCTYDQLADAGLGNETLGKVELRGGRVVARVERELGGVTISARDEGLRGPRLWDAAADLILENRLFKGAGDAVRDDLHLWGVLADWPAEERMWDDTPAPAPRAYLVERLKLLGLTRSDELALLEADDLRPDLVAELDVPAYELERFADDFPRQWEHMGCVYECLVQATSRKIILEPANKKAKRGKDPKAGVLPRFRGFSVYFRNASRVVRVR